MSRFTLRFLAVAAAALVAGCQSSSPEQRLPAPVAAQVNHDFPEARITAVDRIGGGGSCCGARSSPRPVQYRVELLTPYDQPRKAVYDEKGNFVSGDHESWTHPRP
jgi:hypothetical protein